MSSAAVKTVRRINKEMLRIAGEYSAGAYVRLFILRFPKLNSRIRRVDDAALLRTFVYISCP
jgi:hypothetical protein